MDLIIKLLNIPILQLFGSVVVLVLAERAGIPIFSIFKAIFKINGNGNGNGNGYQLQIDGLKEDVKRIEKQIDTISSNHLPHLEEKMTNIQSDVSWIKGKLDK